jgi:hypothetical protein
MPDPILTTLSKLVALYDGVAEATGDRQLTVLLTENIAKQLKLPEEVTLATTADTANSVFVTYHSELLERFTGLLNQRGIVSAIEIAYQGHLKTTGFEKQLLQTLIPQNGLIRYLDAKPAPTRYLWCHVAYTAEADEKRIGMVSFLVNELTMVTPVEIGDALFWEADRLSVTEMAPITEESAVILTELIERTAAELIDADLHNWQAKLARAKARDEERLSGYYHTISQEIRRRIGSRHLVGEEEAKELARIAATERELEAKLADLQSRYALKVSASLHSVLVIQLPTIHLSCELVRKKHRRVVTAVWNPFTRTIEPLRCEVSGVPVSEFYLDDTSAKVIAPNVWHQKHQ